MGKRVYENTQSTRLGALLEAKANAIDDLAALAAHAMRVDLQINSVQREIDRIQMDIDVLRANR